MHSSALRSSFYTAPSIFHCQYGLGSIDLPKSLILYTPAALELALRCPLTIPLSSGGDDDRPEMAESTLVRGSTVSADIMAEGRGIEAWQEECGLQLMKALRSSDLFDQQV